jgi:peptidoglycan/xylan/chitin deacetylase (PgdA/CDA1 family)
MANVKNGSIVVFHDNKKAFPRLQYVLPRVLKKLAQQGYSFRSL